MAQGAVKPKKAPAPKSNKPSGGSRKGPQQIAPKKNAILKKQKKLLHKYSSGLTEKTERMLGEKAGYLEMLGGGKKKSTDKKKEVKGAAAKGGKK